MEFERDGRRFGRLIWGLFLIALGVAFLLERTGMLNADIGQLWPVVFFVIAISHLAQRRPGSAVMFLLMGAWFFAVTFGWSGLSYANSWGLLLVAVGAGVVVSAVSGEDARMRERLLARKAESHD